MYILYVHAGAFGPHGLVVHVIDVCILPTLILRVVFDGSPDGEVWYQLQLSATDPAPVTLPDLTCELGK